MHGALGLAFIHTHLEFENVRGGLGTFLESHAYSTKCHPAVPCTVLGQRASLPSHLSTHTGNRPRDIAAQ